MTNKVPNIRFKGFTDDWEQRKLGELGEIMTGSTPSTATSKYYSEHGIPWVTPTDIEGNIISDTSKKLSEEGVKVGRVVPANTILCTCIASIGKNALLTVKGSFNQQINSLTPSQENNPYFLLTESELWSKELKRIAGAGTMQIVNKSEFSELSTMVPRLDEQQKIGEYFSNLDRLITLHQRKCDQTKELKKFMLQKMFPKKGEKNPEIRFSGFTDDWEQRKVSDIFKITRGYVLSATETIDTNDESNCFPVYSSQTKNDGLMGYYSDYLYEDAITWTTDGANAGTVRYRTGKFYCTNVCGVLLSEDGYANKAVSEVLNSVAWKYVSHVGNPKLMNNVMAEIEIVIPKFIEEQKVISKYFDKIDRLITLHQRKCEQLKELKKFMLQNMFPKKG